MPVLFADDLLPVDVSEFPGLMLVLVWRNNDLSMYQCTSPEYLTKFKRGWFKAAHVLDKILQGDFLPVEHRYLRD